MPARTSLQTLSLTTVKTRPSNVLCLMSPPIPSVIHHHRGAREANLTVSGEFSVPLSGALGVLTSESGQEGDWLGVEAVVSLLPHQYLCPQTHPESTAGIRVNGKARTHLWGAQTPWERNRDGGTRG